jgi:hypothetical protein
MAASSHSTWLSVDRSAAWNASRASRGLRARTAAGCHGLRRLVSANTTAIGARSSPDRARAPWHAAFSQRPPAGTTPSRWWMIGRRWSLPSHASAIEQHRAPFQACLSDEDRQRRIPCHAAGKLPDDRGHEFRERGGAAFWQLCERVDDHAHRQLRVVRRSAEMLRFHPCSPQAIGPLPASRQGEHGRRRNTILAAGLGALWHRCRHWRNCK